MNTITPKLNSNITKYSKAESDALVHQPWITADDLVNDIEHMILKIVKPYSDPSNPMLHFDELQAECRAKLAQILHDGCLMRCVTRAKAFAFVKTSFSNHIRSLVQKHAFTEKRTGVKPPPKLRGLRRNWNSINEARPVNVSLDDEEEYIQVGRHDPAFSRIEFLEELRHRLTEEERMVFAHLIQNDRAKRGGVRLTLPEQRFKLVLASIRAKGVAVCERAG